MTVTDPVCGMKVDPHDTSHHFELGGTTYHFCSQRCLDKFKADPDGYLTQRENESKIARSWRSDYRNRAVSDTLAIRGQLISDFRGLRT